MTVDLLRESYYSLKKQAAPGVDGVTWEEYGQTLEARLNDLHGRIHRGAYRAKPSRRVYIPKSDGRQRPLWRGMRKVNNQAGSLFRLAAYSLHHSLTPMGDYLRRMKKKNCFLKDKFWRITTKSGGKKAPAVVAIAHTLLILTYQVLTTGQAYQDKQAPALDQRQKQRMIRHHIRRLGKLGVAVCSSRPGAPAIADSSPPGIRPPTQLEEYFRKKKDLLDEIDDLRQENQDLQDQLDAVADIVAPAEEEDEEDNDDEG